MNLELKKARQRSWYRKHRARLIGERVARKRDLRVWLRRLKETLKCIRCGFDNSAALQFHHRDPKQKSFDVCSGVLSGRCKETIQREIDKCDVLCANCHAIEHYIV